MYQIIWHYNPNDSYTAYVSVHDIYIHPVVTICTNRFNIQQFYLQSTQCIYVFCMDLRKYNDYFPIRY